MAINDEFEVEFEGTVLGGSDDHRTLTNRDAENQHPISAINGLTAALDSKVELTDLSAVALSGDYDDLTNKPDISGFATKTEVTEGLATKANTADLATVATTGDYDDLIDKPILFSGDYNDLTNKPTLFSGDYDDLTDKPDLSVYAESVDLATVATSGSYSDLINKPSLATVATSGSYTDLSNTPTIPTVPTNVSAFTNDSGYLTLATLPIYDGTVQNGGSV